LGRYPAYFINVYRSKYKKIFKKILNAISEAGTFIAGLFLLLVAVAVIDVCINFTGIVTVDVLN